MTKPGFLDEPNLATAVSTLQFAGLKHDFAFDLTVTAASERDAMRLRAAMMTFRVVSFALPSEPFYHGDMMQMRLPLGVTIQWPADAATPAP